MTATDWFDAWVSPARFEPYLVAAGFDRIRARALYEWNARLAAAFLHDLSHLEVGVRNAYDRALQASRVAGDLHWSDRRTVETLFPTHVRRSHRSPRRDVNAIARRSVLEAVSRAGGEREGAALSGKVVAELPFGFWTFLTSDRLEKTIWLPYLQNAYGTGTNRAEIRRALEMLRRLRNRVAHHESVFRNAEQHRRLLVAQVRRLSPEAADDLTRRSEVRALLARRP